MSFLIEEFSNRFGRILFNGYDEEKNLYPVKPAHFIPYNSWITWEWNREINSDLSHRFRIGGSYQIDVNTGDRYSNDDPRVKRLKCLALVVATPIVQAIGLVLNIANRIAKLVTGAVFWHPIYGNSSFKARLTAFGKDLIGVVLSPIIFVGLELSAVYGLIRPYDGGKLYATFERVAYGKAMLAPCFQPEPRRHLFGGDINNSNAW